MPMCVARTAAQTLQRVAAAVNDSECLPSYRLYRCQACSGRVSVYKLHNPSCVIGQRAQRLGVICVSGCVRCVPACHLYNANGCSTSVDPK